MEMLVKAYGNAAMKRTTLHKWYSRYENGYESVMDEQRSGRPTSIMSQKVQKIKELLDKDRHIFSQGVDCSVGTVHTIIHENLNMRRLCARWIPKMLSECQKLKGFGADLVCIGRLRSFFSVCYLLSQFMDFDQTCTDTLLEKW